MASPNKSLNIWLLTIPIFRASLNISHAPFISVWTILTKNKSENLSTWSSSLPNKLKMLSTTSQCSTKYGKINTVRSILHNLLAPCVKYHSFPFASSSYSFRNSLLKPFKPHLNQRFNQLLKRNLMNTKHLEAIVPIFIFRTISTATTISI